MDLRRRLRGPRNDLTGMTFAYLHVVAYTRTPSGEIVWVCKCKCGKETSVPADRLRSGHTRSCGCLRINLITKHGMHSTPEYTAYLGARSRCQNSKDTGYSQYGNRGIRFLFSSFEQFISDVGLRPSSKHSLDRRENEGHYEPGNCRWSTKSEQMKNRRKHKAIQNFSTEDLLGELHRRGEVIR